MSSSASRSGSSTAIAIFVAGLIAGTLDLTAASIQTLQAGGTLTRLCQYIASGAFGSAAFTGGTAMVAWGVGFHYLIAFSLTIFFFAIYPRVALLRVNVFLTAVLYGLFAWAVTNLVIVRLSAIPVRPINPEKAAIAAAILVVCIGLPLALLAKRHFSGKKAA